MCSVVQIRGGPAGNLLIYGRARGERFAEGSGRLTQLRRLIMARVAKRNGKLQTMNS